MIIIAGVVFGFVTLVEVASLAILYVLVISLLAYRSITVKDLFPNFSCSWDASSMPCL
jgi:TRAP-type C4-dicarboxylate transport system permease large subunit